MTVYLRLATPADAPMLTAWDGEPHVIAGHGEDGAWNWPAELPRMVDWRELLIGMEGERPVGFMQIIDPAREETHYWGDCPPNLRAIDIWLGAASDLGRGLGTQMMRLAIERCFASPEVEAILVDPMLANRRAHRFYERLGFSAEGVRWFDQDECLVFRLERSSWASLARG